MKKCSKLLLALLVVSTLLPVTILNAQDETSSSITHEYQGENTILQDDQVSIPWKTTISYEQASLLQTYEVSMDPQATITIAAIQVRCNDKLLQNGIDYELKFRQQDDWRSSEDATTINTNGMKVQFLKEQAAKQVIVQFTTQYKLTQDSFTTTVQYDGKQQQATYQLSLPSSSQLLQSSTASTITTTTDTLTSIGGSYDLGYLLHNYNVFALSNYVGSHVVGPMIVLGSAKGNNGTLSVGGSTIPNQRIEPHLVPSYFKGDANLNTVIAGSDVKLYLGTINKTKNITISDANSQVHPDRLHYTDDFITAAGLDSIKSQVKTYMAYEGVDSLGNMIKKVEIKNDVISMVLSKDYTKENPYTSQDGSYQMYRKDADIGENTKIKKVVVELQLGYNFEFDSFENVQTLVYDYVDTEEAITTTTFIGTKQAGEVSLPRIMKTVPDEFGSTLGDEGYQFDSLESTKGLNVIYFMNEAVTTVNIGQIKTSSGAIYKDGQRKLTGHLVAPSADVMIVSGDYNGCVIGKNINSTAEGHMWPFNLDVGINFYKLVNNEKPSADETFRFRLHDISQVDGTTDLFADSNLNGLVHFQLGDYKKAGTYIYKVSEEAQTGYTDKTKAIYVKVDVALSNTAGSSVLIPKVSGYYRSMSGATVDEASKITDKVTYHNQRDLSVKKVWVDTSGNPLDTTKLPDVNATLWRKGVQADGNQLVYNIYAKKNGDSSYTKIATKVLRSADKTQLYIKQGSTYSSRVNLSNPSIWLDVDYTKLKNEGLTVMDTQGYYTDFSVTNVQKDQEVNLYYTSYKDAPSKDSFVMDWKLTDANNQKALMLNIKTIDEQVNAFTLNQANNWQISFPELTSTVTKDGVNYKCSYYVKEQTVPGYTTTIENNQTISGTITIRNVRIPTLKLKIQKVSCTGNNQALANANFQLLDKNGNVLTFTKQGEAYQYDPSGIISTVTSNDKGSIPFTNLSFGDYVLKETSPPKGFAIQYSEIFLHIDPIPGQSYLCFGSKTSIETKHEFTNITTDTSTNEFQYSLTVENIPDLKMPQTGGIPKKTYQKDGTLFIAMSILFSGIFYIKQKERKVKR